MLGNSEKIENVDRKAVFNKMLAEVPWDNLKAYILSNAQLTKLCTSGGFRLDVKFRKRAEAFIQRDVEKSDYSEIQCNGVFASWYPVHKDLHEALENYFHSDEYEKYRQENGIAEDEYVLPDEKFNELYSVSEFEAWRMLLCFSPLKFTHEQADKILEDKKDDAALMDRLTKAEAERDDLSKKSSSLAAELEKLRAKQQADQNEMQELRRQNRQLKADLEQAQKRADTAIAEMKRANQQASQAGQAIEQREAEIREELGRVNQRQQGEIERLGKELAAWQARHEEQCGLNRGLAERAAAAERRSLDSMNARLEMEKKLNANGVLVDALLEKIDWPHVGASMKLTPTMKRNFNSLVKRLDYDEDRNLTIEGTLKNFWGRLQARELTLIDAIAKSSVKELEKGTIEDYWQNIADMFPEVQIDLEARITMLNILQDIFYQNYTDEDLQTSVLPSKPAKKTKKAAEE